MPLFDEHNNSNQEDMYKKIYHTYQHRVFLYIAGKISDRNDVRDIFQNVFIHLWQYKKALGGPNTENIIFKTCNQEIADFCHKNNKRFQSLESDYPDRSEEQIQYIIKKEERIDAIQKNIDLLPDTTKQIFTMNKINGIKQKQIASDLKITQKTVEKQVSKAMTLLRNALKNS